MTQGLLTKQATDHRVQCSDVSVGLLPEIPKPRPPLNTPAPFSPAHIHNVAQCVENQQGLGKMQRWDNSILKERIGIAHSVPDVFKDVA